MSTNKPKGILHPLLSSIWRYVEKILEKILIFEKKLSLRFSQYRHKRNLFRAVVLILITLVFLQGVSQLQFKNLLDTEKKAFTRIEQYAKFYNSSKPTINEQGFAQYENYFGVSAWNEFISRSLSSQAGLAFDQLTLLQYQLESADVWPLFTKKTEAKKQIVKYFANVNEYLKEVQNCVEAKCLDDAAKILDKVNGEVAELALKRAVPRFDVLRLEDKLNDY